MNNKFSTIFADSFLMNQEMYKTISMGHGFLTSAGTECM